jgi:hypothetical protein
VTELVSTPDKLALLAAALNIAGTQGTASTDTFDLAQLTALPARLQPEGPAAVRAAGAPQPGPPMLPPLLSPPPHPPTWAQGPPLPPPPPPHPPTYDGAQQQQHPPTGAPGPPPPHGRW